MLPPVNWKVRSPGWRRGQEDNPALGERTRLGDDGDTGGVRAVPPDVGMVAGTSAGLGLRPSRHVPPILWRDGALCATVSQEITSRA